MRPLQWWLKTRGFFRNRGNPLRMIKVTRRCRRALAVWREPGFLSQGPVLGAPGRRLVLATDASLTGWGAVMSGRPARGLWSGRHLTWHINCLEMLAVFLALKHFLPDLRGRHVLVRTDNTTVVSYINRQGAASNVIPFGLLHMRPLQWWLKTRGFFRNRGNPLRMIKVTRRCRRALAVWREPGFLSQGPVLGTPGRRVVLATDASLTGWGAVMSGRPARGLWSGRHLTWHINCLEMLAVFLALKHFLPDLRGRHVLVRTDNTMVVSYINRQGGLRSRPLYRLARQILVWSQGKLLSLRAAYIPGYLNVGADALTCLHWACKRNHKHIVAYLLNSGADKEILTAKDELAVQLTSKPEIRRLLGVEEEEHEPEVKDAELPIIPNYLSNPPFLYCKVDKSDLSVARHVSQNGTSDHLEAVVSEPATLSPIQEQQQQQQQRLYSDAQSQPALSYVSMVEPSSIVPNQVTNGTLSMEVSPEVHHSNHNEYAHNHSIAQNSPVCPPLPSGSAGSNPTITRQQSVPHQLNGSQPGGSMPAFQPFFFTSTFPVNVRELVLKVRIQNPHARENDFIEVELDRQELTYRALLRVCCRELDISAEHVEKIRKLPNTMLRKDKDVARLQDFQELEVVLEKAESLSLFSGPGGLNDRPCYNMKASRLTY
ncbi:hypothetical protein PGIGA_G00046990 [Pangasianodon gigas]|uniref:Uncharacterized protein n=1 Tax=Pangasianodon gigas TaxID=30993 RepID=A0ACC5X2Q1_PANGG|nr:hypothetical protein [Pangasianodon gigas]